MAKKKETQQVVVIHGGDVFESDEAWLESLQEKKEPRFETMMDEDWKDTLQGDLGDAYEVVIPSMPNKQNAKYNEWKIWFEKHIPHFDEQIVLVGHSLGGIFVAKYLSENEYPKQIKATFLVAAPFEMSGMDYSLADFAVEEDLSLFEKQGGDINVYHSKDDPVVPFADFEKYQEALSGADTRAFEDKEHFNGELPEIVQDIQRTQ
jgi:predicted alpha/beta hydrolase family esterase